eukprot:TRINITY_DN91804_c0_g1_i1.p1 TRINITY_DN91804_c0_g1~~TRINITY_DN91804_c0_g1_i1.p1  ORF type:complete len:637 (-),score=122.52 TRINITY_DN91804_c0_g1_i1:68-1978(-)
MLASEDLPVAAKELPYRSFGDLLFALRTEREAVEAELGALRAELCHAEKCPGRQTSFTENRRADGSGAAVWSSFWLEAGDAKMCEEARMLEIQQDSLALPHTRETTGPISTRSDTGVLPRGSGDDSEAGAENDRTVGACVDDSEATVSDAAESSNTAVTAVTTEEQLRLQEEPEQVMDKVETHNQSLAIALRGARDSETGLDDTLAEVKSNRRRRNRMTMVDGAHIAIYQHRLKKLTQSLRFDLFFGFMIVLNAVFMAVETDFALADPGSDHRPDWLHKIGLFFTLAFSTELLLRLAADGRRFFLSCQLWNYFDCILVAIAIVEEVLVQQDDLLDMRQMRLLRLARGVKILRMARLIRFISGLRTLLYSLMGTMRQVVWAFLLIFCLMFVFAVTVGQVVSEALNESYSEEIDDLLVKYFGSVVRCLVTVYMAVSGGVSYIECAVPLEVVGSGIFLTFLIYVAVVQWLVLNVVTGTFCESAAAAARKNVSMSMQNYREQRDEFMKQAKAIFNTIDEDESGTVQITEIKSFLDQEPARVLFAALDLEIGDVQDLFVMLDKDGGDAIDLEEFVFGCLQLRGSAKALDVAKIRYDSKELKDMLYPFMDKVLMALAASERREAADTDELQHEKKRHALKKL